MLLEKKRLWIGQASRDGKHAVEDNFIDEEVPLHLAGQFVVAYKNNKAATAIGGTDLREDFSTGSVQSEQGAPRAVVGRVDIDGVNLPFA